MVLRKAFAPLIASCLVAFCAGSAAGMEISPEMAKRFLSGDEGRDKSSSPFEDQGPTNAVDTGRYLVGGGDGFQIAIIGLPSQEYFPTVDADGNLYDGDLGLIPLGKITLAKAQAIIEAKVKKNLRKNYPVYVALRKVKNVNVIVSGSVGSPGTYVLPGSMRILDAVRAGNGGSLPPFDQFDYRRVAVRNGDSLQYYDLLRFISKQDIDQNPYVYPGDDIRITRLDARIFVTGEIQEPAAGWMGFRPGETLGDVLKVIRPKQSADTSFVIVQQASGPSKQSARKVAWNDAGSIQLGANDVITVGAREIGTRADTVTVTGEVRVPGTFPVNPGQGTAADALRMAGGPTELADAGRAFVIRHRKRDMLSGTDRAAATAGRGRPGPTMLQSVRPEVASSVSDLGASGDFTFIDASLSNNPPTLEDGDEIHVPRKERFIYVSGNVKKPGAYPFEAGAGYMHYIDAAGGYTDKADPRNQFAMTSYNGMTRIKDVSDVVEGDLIVVPASVEYKRYTNIYLPLIQMIPALIQIILTIVIIEKQH